MWLGNLCQCTPLGYKNYNIVHLEMVNILVVIRTLGSLWRGQKVVIHCDNQAVVTVLNSGHTRDMTLPAMASNFNMAIAKLDIDLETVHIQGKLNIVADTLSRLSISLNLINKLYQIFNSTLVYLIAGENPQLTKLFVKAAHRMHHAFFRILNLAPPTISSYDPLKQLARADVFFNHPGASIPPKWSKTIQMNNSVRLIKIPVLGSSPLCPVKALKKLLSLTPNLPNNPLFQIKCYQR